MYFENRSKVVHDLKQKIEDEFAESFWRFPLKRAADAEPTRQAAGLGAARTCARACLPACEYDEKAPDVCNADAGALPLCRSGSASMHESCTQGVQRASLLRGRRLGAQLQLQLQAHAHQARASCQPR